MGYKGKRGKGVGLVLDLLVRRRKRVQLIRDDLLRSEVRLINRMVFAWIHGLNGRVRLGGYES